MPVEASAPRDERLDFHTGVARFVAGSKRDALPGQIRAAQVAERCRVVCNDQLLDKSLIDGDFAVDEGQWRIELHGLPIEIGCNKVEAKRLSAYTSEHGIGSSDIEDVFGQDWTEVGSNERRDLYASKRPLVGVVRLSWNGITTVGLAHDDKLAPAQIGD